MILTHLVLFSFFDGASGDDTPVADAGRKLISPALIAHPSLTT